MSGSPAVPSSGLWWSCKLVFLGGVSGGAVGGVVEKLAVHVGRTVCPLHPTS